MNNRNEQKEKFIVNGVYGFTIDAELHSDYRNYFKATAKQWIKGHQANWSVSGLTVEECFSEIINLAEGFTKLVAAQKSIKERHLDFKFLDESTPKNFVSVFDAEKIKKGV